MRRRALAGSAAEAGFSASGTLIDYRGLTAGGSAVNGLKHPVPLHRCPAKVIRLACELERAWREPQQDKPLRAQQLFIELLAELYSELRAGRSQPATAEQALHYMESRYSDDLTRSIWLRWPMSARSIFHARSASVPDEPSMPI